MRLRDITILEAAHDPDAAHGGKPQCGGDGVRVKSKCKTVPEFAMPKAGKVILERSQS